MSGIAIAFVGSKLHGNPEKGFVSGELDSTRQPFGRMWFPSMLEFSTEAEAFCVTVLEPGPEARLVPAAAEAGPAEPALPDVVLVDDLRVPEVREVVLKAELASPRGDILVSTAHFSPLPVQPQ